MFPEAPQKHLIRYLDSQSKAIVCLEPEVCCHLSGKVLHELRVAIRRTRAAYWILRKSSPDNRFKKLDRDLKSLGKALGKVRELDVAIQDASHYGIDSSKLKARRKVVQNRLRKRLSRDQRNRLGRRLSVAGQVASRISPLLFNEAHDNLRTWLNHVKRRRMHGQRRLHRLRVSIKKARYALEAMGKPIGPIRSLQDLLGDAHDLEILRALVGKNAKMKAEQRSLNDKALHLIEPVLQYTVNQLRKE